MTTPEEKGVDRRWTHSSAATRPIDQLPWTRAISSTCSMDSPPPGSLPLEQCHRHKSVVSSGLRSLDLERCCVDKGIACHCEIDVVRPLRQPLLCSELRIWCDPELLELAIMQGYNDVIDVVGYAVKRRQAHNRVSAILRYHAIFLNAFGPGPPVHLA